MASELLPTNYTDATWEGLKKYRQVNNPDGTVSFEDVTVYTDRERSFFGAKNANAINDARNKLMNKVGALTSNVAALKEKVSVLVFPTDSVFLQCAATYDQGIIALSELPESLPDVFTVRFITPTVVIKGDVLQIGEKIINLLGVNGNPLPNKVWERDVLVSIDINYAEATGFCVTGGIFEEPSKTYGVSIDLTNSSPEGAVTYIDDAVGMIPGDASWDDTPIFKGIRPCVLKSGVVQYYLNPDNYEQKADGSPAVITGVDGDVMVEIPKLGYQIVTTGDTLTVRVTANPNDREFRYYAHTRDVEGDRDYLYIGAYKGALVNDRLRSITDSSPVVSSNYPTLRTAAQANGAAYDMVSFYPLTLLQCLFLIRFKNRDSQAALGQGYVNGLSVNSTTGSTNAKGMYFGETTGKLQMKCFGIEDLWGNVHSYIDGLFVDSNRHIMTAFQNFNDTGEGYIDRGESGTSNFAYCLSKPQGTSETGFIVKATSTSYTADFTDYVGLYQSKLPLSGGSRTDGKYAGIFYLNLLNSATASSPTEGARLMFM